MATHSSVLAWKTPGTGEPDGLLSMGLHRVRHDWSNLEAAAAGRSAAGGHGNPLQYSCLENPMDREAWWATVHGVAKSWCDWKIILDYLEAFNIITRYLGEGGRRSKVIRRKCSDKVEMGECKEGVMNFKKKKMHSTFWSWKKHVNGLSSKPWKVTSHIKHLSSRILISRTWDFKLMLL